MQVSPALPWTAETEGGTIRLSAAVSYQDLLDGVLQFTLDHNGTTLIANVGEGSAGVVIGYGEHGTVNIVYTIDRFEGELTELAITRGTGGQVDGYVLASVERVTPPEVIPTPSLPWHYTPSGSWSLRFRQPITQSELINNLSVVLEDTSTHETIEATIREDDGVVLFEGGNSAIFMRCNTFAGSVQSLTMTLQESGGDYSCVSIEKV